MSDKQHSISITLKGGTGYDSPWIVVYGDDPAEVSEKLKNLGDLVEQVASQLPLGRIGVADDIARAVLFCASDLSAFMTGSTVVVDAGDLVR